MKFTHREHVITVRKDGMFVSGTVSARSLEAIRRKLDEKYNAKPFKALRIGWARDGSKSERVTVIGMRRREKFGTPYTEFSLDNGLVARDLFVDTPANRRLLDAALALRRKHRKLREKYAALEKAAIAKVERVKGQ